MANERADPEFLEKALGSNWGPCLPTTPSTEFGRALRQLGRLRARWADAGFVMANKM